MKRDLWSVFFLYYELIFLCVLGSLVIRMGHDCKAFWVFYFFIWICLSLFTSFSKVVNLVKKEKKWSIAVKNNCKNILILFKHNQTYLNFMISPAGQTRKVKHSATLSMPLHCAHQWPSSGTTGTSAPLVRRSPMPLTWSDGRAWVTLTQPPLLDYWRKTTSEGSSLP